MSESPITTSIIGEATADGGGRHPEDDTTGLSEVTASAAAAAYMPEEINNNKWSKNGFGAPVNKQSGKFTKQESELVRKSVEEYCAAKQISTARLCSECDHKVCMNYEWDLNLVPCPLICHLQTLD